MEGKTADPNMAYSNYGKYLETEVYSADPVKLVCMLYRGAIEATGAARRYLKIVEVPFVEVPSDDWLAQVLWGQRFTLDACRRLGIDPDAIRGGDPRYRRALAET